MFSEEQIKNLKFVIVEVLSIPLLLVALVVAGVLGAATYQMGIWIAVFFVVTFGVLYPLWGVLSLLAYIGHKLGRWGDPNYEILHTIAGCIGIATASILFGYRALEYFELL